MRIVDLVVRKRRGAAVRFWRRFSRDDNGSIALWVGLALVTFIGCAGMAIDTARGYMVKSRLSQALDAAALAGAKSLLGDTRDDDIRMFFAANFDADALSATVSGPQIYADTTKNTVRLTATATIDTTLMSVLGFTTMTVAAEATAIRAINGLDVVMSIDVSGSMCSPCSKIQAAITAANTMVDTLYNDPNPKTVTINSTTYDLLNIGMVPWNAKVNVRTNKVINTADFDPALTVAEPVTPFVNPLTGSIQSVVYNTNISEVRLLNDPGAGWKGGIYARYIDDNDQANDADLTLGYAQIGGKDWHAFEPIPLLEGESRSGRWDDSAAVYPVPGVGGTVEGGTVISTSHPSGLNWNSSSNSRRERSCYGAYWNDDFNDANQHPLAVPDAPAYWVKANNSQGQPGGNDCTDTSPFGIVPLQGVKDSATKSVVTDSINALYSGGNQPNGNTNAPQGLYWAWEVLMPGAPFNQAKAAVPFKRTQAIVLLTDGQNTGNNGDAYKGVFGPDNGAGTTNEHGVLANGSNNNFDNRLLQLANSIKGANPEQGVKIFVVQYEESNQNLKNLLKQVATEPNAPYYFYAPGATELQNAFKQIAASLSVLRLSN
jgi:Flp pilus assembly protein TadG